MLGIRKDFFGNVVVEVVVVLLGNEQRVNRRFGFNIVKCQADVILVDDLGGNLAGNDFAEDAVVTHESAFLLRFLSCLRLSTIV